MSPRRANICCYIVWQQCNQGCGQESVSDGDVLAQLAQLEERSAFNRVVVGSSPILGASRLYLQ